jgi:hypothetical protein
MTDEPRFTIILEQVHDDELKVRFDWEGVADLHTDEPEPLGGRAGRTPPGWWRAPSRPRRLSM